MTVRSGGNVSLIAGTLAPRRYDEVQFLYSDDGTVILSRFYANGTFLRQVRTVLDDQGREIIVRLESTPSGL